MRCGRVSKPVEASWGRRWWVGPAVSGARLNVRLQPRASRDRIVGWNDGTLRVQVHAPPVDDAANQALVRLVSRALDMAPSAVRIVRGHKHRDKLLEIAGLSLLDCMERLVGAGRVDKKNRGD